MNPKPIWSGLNVEQLVTRFVGWLPSLFSAFLLLAAFWILHRITLPGLSRLLRRVNLDPALRGMLERVYKFTLMLFGALMAVNQLGINVGAALAGLGVVGLTIGFAARDTLSNVISGFLIFWDKPFHAGDWVTVAGNYGKVIEITMRTTRLLTWDNTTVIIPNETAITQVLVNHSSMGRKRVEVPLAGIAVDGEFQKKEEAVLGAVRRTEGVLKDPAPDIVVKALNGPSADLLIYAWIARAEEEYPVISRILEATEAVLLGTPEAATTR